MSHPHSWLRKLDFGSKCFHDCDMLMTLKGIFLMCGTLASCFLVYFRCSITGEYSKSVCNLIAPKATSEKILLQKILLSVELLYNNSANLGS